MNPAAFNRTSKYASNTTQHRIACGIVWGTTTDPKKITVIDFKGLFAVVKWPGGSIGSTFREWVPGQVELRWAKLVADGPADWPFSNHRSIWTTGKGDDCDGVATPRICRELAICCLWDHLRVARSLTTGQIAMVAAHDSPDGEKSDGEKDVIPIGHDVFKHLAAKGVLKKLGAGKIAAGVEIQKWHLDKSRIDHR